MKIDVITADYNNPIHARDIPALLNEYAIDPMGGDQSLDEHVKLNLVGELAKLPHAFSVLCYVDGQAAGLANCFYGFSTFQCKPLINIHDLMVSPKFRGLKLSQHLLAKIESIGLKNNCCKITLEVLSGNQVAKNAYLKFGFNGYELNPEIGSALFWEKKL